MVLDATSGTPLDTGTVTGPSTFAVGPNGNTQLKYYWYYPVHDFSLVPARIAFLVTISFTGQTGSVIERTLNVPEGPRDFTIG